jgi:hypothetical protein
MHSVLQDEAHHQHSKVDEPTLKEVFKKVSQEL